MEEGGCRQVSLPQVGVPQVDLGLSLSKDALSLLSSGTQPGQVQEGGLQREEQVWSSHLGPPLSPCRARKQ